MDIVQIEATSKLEKIGYRPLSINMPGVVMHIKMIGGVYTLVGFIDCMNGIPYSGAQIIELGRNLSSVYNTGNILFIAFTRDSYNTRLALQGNTLWIFNQASMNLEVYGTPDYMFSDIRDCLIRPANTGKKLTLSKVFNFNNLIILINAIVFIIMAQGGKTTNPYYLYIKGGAIVPGVIDYNQYWRLFTSMFMHAGIVHILSNMAVLFFIGDNLERAVGHVKYMIIYMASGILSGLFTMIYYNLTGNYNTVCVGASGAIFGVVGALIYILIKNRGKLEDLTLPAMGLFVGYNIYAGLRNTGVCMPAHISGLVIGFLLAMLLYRKRGLAYED